MQPVDNQNGQVENYNQPQFIQTSVTEQTVKEVGAIVIAAFTAFKQMRQDSDIEIAKHQAEKAIIQKAIQLEQIKSDERTTNTLVRWDTYFKVGVLIISFGSIIAIQFLAGSTLTTTIVPVVTFILGSVFKNQINDFVKVRTKKERESNMSTDEND